MDLSYSKQYKKMYSYLEKNFITGVFSPKYLSYDLDIRIEDVNNLLALLTTYNLINREYEEGNFLYSLNTSLKIDEKEKIFESIDLALQYINTNKVAMKNVILIK